MSSGKYKCHKEFTNQQREDDSDNGIMENEHRTIEINAQAKTFKYVYHYYYEYENCMYEMVTQTSNDTTLEGNYQEEGGKLTAVITKGNQKAKVYK